MKPMAATLICPKCNKSIVTIKILRCPHCGETDFVESWSEKYKLKLPSGSVFASDFKDGMAAVAIKSNDDDLILDISLFSGYRSLYGDTKYNHKWGFIDASGNIIVDFIYDDVSDFSRGVSIIGIEERVVIEGREFYETRRGLIDKTGEVILEPQYHDIEIMSDRYLKVSRYGAYGLIDFNNNVIIPLEYKDLLEPSEGYVAIKGPIYKQPVSPLRTDRKRRGMQNTSTWAFVDLENNLICQPQYMQVHSFSEGLAAVFSSSWKFIDVNGDVVFDCIYGEVDDFHDGRARITITDDNGKLITHYLLKDGSYIIDGHQMRIDSSIITKVYGFSEGLAKAMINGKWGYINTDGEIVLNNIPASTNVIIGDFVNEYAAFEGLYGTSQCINVKGELVIFEEENVIEFPRKYSAVVQFAEGLYQVWLADSGMNGIIDKDENIIVPFCFGYKGLGSSSLNDLRDYIVVDDMSGDCMRTKWGYERAILYNLSGQRIIKRNIAERILINPDYHITDVYFKDGLAAVSKNGLWGFINECCEEVIPIIYAEVVGFKDGYCLVCVGDSRYTIIDKYGKQMIPVGRYDSFRLENNKFIVRDFDGEKFVFDM
jgi:hypothetical protein